MPAPPLDRGPSASVTLHFDGSASPNPGPAGCAAVATLTLAASDSASPTSETLQWSAPLGHATSNAAEYHGLILGLRALLSHLHAASVRHAHISLTVVGDSRLVISHMTRRSRLSSASLAPLYAIATHLASRFLHISFRACPRAQNAPADRLANAARLRGPSPPTKAVFYPSLLSFIDVWVAGHHALASHDLGTAGADPTCFIDAGFLQTLPGGHALLANIRNPHPLSFVVARVDMTVLGTVSLDVAVAWRRRPHPAAPTRPDQTAVVEFVVVDHLPVPVHVSVRHPAIHEPTGDYNIMGDIKARSHVLPERYQAHRYWHSQVDFLGIEHSFSQL